MQVEAKRDEETGELVLKDGEPVYEIDGKEVTASEVATAAASKARREAKGLRNRAKGAEERLEKYEPVFDALGDLDPDEAAALLDAARARKNGDGDDEQKTEVATLTRRLERSEKEKGEAESKVAALTTTVERGQKLEALAGSAVLKKTIYDGLPRQALRQWGSVLKVKHGDDGEDSVVGVIDGAEVTVDEALEHAIQHDPDRDGIMKTKTARGPKVRHGKDGKPVSDGRLTRATMTGVEKSKFLREKTDELGSYEAARKAYDALPAE